MISDFSRFYAHEPRILFLDMNSFFASVEQQEHPQWRNDPLIVAPIDADTTSAISVSYQARAFGIKTGTSVIEAKHLCPQIRVVAARPKLYVQYSRAIIELLHTFERVLYIDIDFHHGDGTEKLIKSSQEFSSIYMVSLHGYGELVYPGTGSASDSNANVLNLPINVTINPESRTYVTDEFYQNLFDTQALPWIQSIKPDLIVISNGYDSHQEDKLEGFNITDQTYLYITQKLKNLKKPLLFVTEGGYSVKTISRVTSKMIELLS
jgi:hypothetical protein